MIFFFTRTAQKNNNKKLKTMKKISILLLLLTSIGITTSAQITNSRTSLYSVNANKIIVRSDDKKSLFVFDYHTSMCPTYGSNPPSSLISYTTIYHTDTTMAHLKKISTCHAPAECTMSSL